MRKISARTYAASRLRERAALTEAIAAVGSLSILAKPFGVTYQAVQGWYRNRTPIEHCAVIETLTRGRVQCEQLREDYQLLTARPYRLLANIYRDGDAPRIYIAGPMTGYPDMNYPAFHREAARLRAAGLHVISPAEITLAGTPTWNDYMRACLAQMVKCSALCLLPGWENSRGARLEHHTASAIDNFSFMLAGDGV